MASIWRIISWFRRALVCSLFALASIVLAYSIWSDLARMLLIIQDVQLIPLVVVIWFTIGFPLEMLSPPGWIVLLVWFIAYAVSYPDLAELLE